MVWFHSRFVILFVLLLGLLVACTSPGGDDSLVLEGSGHFLKKTTTTLEPPNGPSLVENSNSITAQSHPPAVLLLLATTGSVAGLGLHDHVLEWEPSGVAVIECTNNGGNAAPGQNFDFSAIGQQGLEPATKNGKVDYTKVVPDISDLLEPRDPIADGCPNANWESRVVRIIWRGGTERLKLNGVTIQTRIKTCTPPVEKPTDPINCPVTQVF